MNMMDTLCVHFGDVAEMVDHDDDLHHDARYMQYQCDDVPPNEWAATLEKVLPLHRQFIAKLLERSTQGGSA